MGGLDLCWGRNEYPGYHIFDNAVSGKTCYPGKDYYNGFYSEPIGPFQDHENIADIEYNETPRMPWRDIAGQFRGDCVKDAAKHFTFYWNFAKECLWEEHNKLTEENDNSSKFTEAPYLMQISELKAKDIDSYEKLKGLHDKFLEDQKSSLERKRKKPTTELGDFKNALSEF